MTYSMASGLVGSSGPMLSSAAIAKSEAQPPPLLRGKLCGRPGRAEPNAGAKSERQAEEAGSGGRSGPGPPAKPLSGDAAARRRVLPRLPELSRSSGLRPRRERVRSSRGRVEKPARCAQG